MRESKGIVRQAVSLFLLTSMLSQSFAAGFATGMSKGSAVQFSDELDAHKDASNFHPSSKKLPVVPKGSEGTIINSQELPSGNYAIQVRFTSFGEGSHDGLKVGDAAWVYYHKEPQFRRVDLMNAKMKKVEQPSEALTAKTKSAFKLDQKSITVAPVKKETQCIAKGSVSALAQSQTDALNEMLLAGASTTDNVPELNGSVEEIFHYIHTAKGNRNSEAVNRKIAVELKKACEKNNIPVAFALAIMQQESHFKVTAHNKKSDAGGLMQMLRGTAKEMATGEERKYVKNGRIDRFDVETIIHLGVKYLAKQYHRYGESRVLASIAYNAGPGRANKIVKGGTWIPKETRKYIPKVEGYYANYQSAVSRGILASN